VRLPIVAGRLRGAWWLPASRGKLLRILGGTYERQQTALFEAHVRPGMTVLDVGAHVGYYTLLAATLAGSAGRVVAFEPNPANARFLRRHATINGLCNVEVVEAGVADGEGTARFDLGSGSGTGRLSQGGEIEVRTVGLDQFCAERGLEPAVVKIDVEGGELDVLRGATRLLTESRPVVFLSTHGDRVHHACIEHLRAVGYAVAPIGGGDLETATELLCGPAAG
jgi:FkbM family methyltransferase